MRIEYSRRFIKELGRAPQKIQLAFKSRLVLFLENKSDPVLNNHALGGKLINCHSINVTGDWRAIYEELENGDIVFFVVLGTHSKIYS